MSTPKFEKPPVIEVAFAVTFRTPKPLQTIHLGLFWKTIQERFPNFSDHPPTQGVVETAPSAVPGPQVQFTIGQLQPLRRIMLASDKENNLLQLQQDRLIFNWKRSPSDSGCPDYASAYADFDGLLNRFEQFLKTENIGDLTYIQYELQYVNLIGQESGLNVVDEASVFVDHTRDTSRKRFLPPPMGYTWSTSYPLPEDSGRLHMMAQAVLVPPKMERHIRYDIVARGIPSSGKDTSRSHWFTTAHDWITNGFEDATSTKLHQSAWNKLTV